MTINVVLQIFLNQITLRIKDSCVGHIMINVPIPETKCGESFNRGVLLAACPFTFIKVGGTN